MKAHTRARTHAHFLPTVMAKDTYLCDMKTHTRTHAHALPTVISTNTFLATPLYSPPCRHHLPFHHLYRRCRRHLFHIATFSILVHIHSASSHSSRFFLLILRAKNISKHIQFKQHVSCHFLQVLSSISILYLSQKHVFFLLLLVTSTYFILHYPPHLPTSS